MERLDLEVAQLVRLDELSELGRTNRAGLLGRLDDLADVLRAQDVLDLDGHALVSVDTRAMLRSNTIATSRCTLTSCAGEPTHGNDCYVKFDQIGTDGALSSPGLSTEQAPRVWKMLKTEYFANCGVDVLTGLDRTP